MKKLYKSRKNKKLAGLLGGVGEFMGIDATILRLAFLLVVVFTGFVPGVVLYITAALVVPNAPALKKK